MAGALIPLAISVAPSIISLIAGLVHKHAPVVETELGPGTGPVKFATVLDYVMAALTKASEAGQIEGVLPSRDIVALLIQVVVTSLKLQGFLTSPGPVAADPAGNGTPKPMQQYVLAPGQRLVVVSGV